MSAPYINRKVKVCGTSQRELNGQKGRAVSYNAESMRYTVLLDSGRSIALKPSHLTPDGSEEEDNSARGGGAGFPAGMPDIRQLLHMLPPWLREKLLSGQVPTLNDLNRLLPPGVTSIHLVCVFGLYIVTIFKFGFLKATILFGILGFLFQMGFGAFSAAGGGVEGVKAASNAIGQRVSQQIRTISNQKVNLSPNISVGAVGIVLLLVLYSILGTSSSSRSSRFVPPPVSSATDSLTAAEAYELGYTDGAAGNPKDFMSHAKENLSPTSFPTYVPPTSYPTYVPPSSYPTYVPPSSYDYGRSSGGGGGIPFGKILTFGLLGRQVYSLGSQPGGGWNMDLARANLMNQGTMQKVFLGLMVLRLFGMSPI